MKSKLLLIAAPVCLLFVSAAKCEWGRTAEDYIQLPLASPPNYSSALCSDLNGGCWVAGDRIGLCHVDRLGNLTWGDTALWFREPSFYAKLVPVDTNSVIVGMLRVINDTTKVYLNRINKEKELLWGEDDITLDSAGLGQYLFDILPGPAPNTFLIHWFGYTRSLQLINADGDKLWEGSGISLPMWSENSKILTTSDNCIIAAHPVDRYPRQNPLVEVTKFNADGEQLWLRRYAIISELHPRLIGWELSDVESDRDGGVILSTKYKRWENQNDSLRYFSLGIMRISGDGDSMWTDKIYERLVEPIEPRWPGTIIDPFGQCEFILNYAGLGHFFAAWVDLLRHSDDDVFKVVSFNANFEIRWDGPLDIILFKSSSRPYGVDSDSSVCYIWRDDDPERGNDQTQQWGQRISINGERLWSDRGRIIQNRGNTYQSAITDGNGGAITMVDTIFPSLQMLNRNGEIGIVIPTSVHENTNPRIFYETTSQIKIFPNPTNSHFNVEFNKEFPNQIFNYRIFDIRGRAIAAGMMMETPYQVGNLPRLSSGEYILQVQLPRTFVSKRFLVIK